MKTDRTLAGAPLLLVLSLALTFTMLAAFAWGGGGLEGIHTQIRVSARTSLVLFLAAYCASCVLRLWPSPRTRWLMKNRRWIGLSFAVSHGLHLIGIVSLAALDPEFSRSAATLVAGGLAYAFIALMAATSNDRAVRWLGVKRWRLLHTVGMHYIWLIFFVSYAPRAASGSAGYVLLTVAMLAALGLRLGRRWTSRRRLPASDIAAA